MENERYIEDGSVADEQSDPGVSKSVLARERRQYWLCE